MQTFTSRNLSAFLLILLFTKVAIYTLQFALIWRLTQQTASGMVLALTGVAIAMPPMLLGLYAGGIIDRSSRKRVMLLSNVALAVCVFSATASYIFGELSVGGALLLILLSAVCDTFFVPASRSLLPTLVSTDNIVKAQSSCEIIVQISTLSGAFIAAYTLERLTLLVLLLVVALGALAASVLLLWLKENSKTVTASALSVERGSLRETLTVLARDRSIAILSSGVVILAFIYTSVSSFYPLLVNTHFKGGPWQSSLIEFTYAAGMLIAPIILRHYSGANYVPVMLSGILLLGTGLITFTYIPAGYFLIFAGICVPIGLLDNLIVVTQVVSAQQKVANTSLGRVLSTVQCASAIGAQFGLLLYGIANKWLQLNACACFRLAGVLLLVAGVLLGLYYTILKIKEEENEGHQE